MDRFEDYFLRLLDLQTATSTQDLPLAACHPTRIRWWGMTTLLASKEVEDILERPWKTYTNSVDEYLITIVYQSKSQIIDLFLTIFLHRSINPKGSIEPNQSTPKSPLPPVPPVSLPTCYLHSSKFSACWVHCFTKRSRKEWGIRPFFRSQERRWRKVASTRCWRCGKNPLGENTGELQMGRLWLNWLNTPWHSGISWTSSSILLKKYWYCHIALNFKSIPKLSSICKVQRFHIYCYAVHTKVPTWNTARWAGISSLPGSIGSAPMAATWKQENGSLDCDVGWLFDNMFVGDIFIWWT